jgi:hypothetical protein
LHFTVLQQQSHTAMSGRRIDMTVCIAYPHHPHHFTLFNAPHILANIPVI